MISLQAIVMRSCLIAFVLLGCYGDVTPPAVALNGEYYAHRPDTLIALIFESRGYWTEEDHVGGNPASLNANGAYTFDGTTLTLTANVPWMTHVRTGVVRHDTIQLDSLTFVR